MNGPKSVDSAIVLRNVTKRFGAVAAVAGVTLRIPRGAVYGLIGPNGAGKTTTFSMLAGFLQPTDGTLEVLGFAPDAVDELRGRLGVLPQDAVLPGSDRVGPLLVHWARLQGMSAADAHTDARAVLAEVAGREWWDTRCSSLSHGMAKRVQLAQALLGSPEVVLLDEPTAGLDPRVAYEVRQIIVKRRGRCTLVISSHNLNELEEMCDGAAILDRGRLVMSGAIGELTASAAEVHFALAAGPVPLAEVRGIAVVDRADFDEASRDLAVHFTRDRADAERVIGEVLTVLLHHQARISGVSKGRGLEQRVMELTA